LKYRRRLQYPRPSPEKLWPVEPIKPAVSARVDQLVKDVRDGVRQMCAKDRSRRRRRRMQTIVTRRLWWWRKTRWMIRCPEWLLCMAVDEVHRCQAWWRDLQVRMLLRRCRRKWWYADWWRRRREREALFGRPANKLLHLPKRRLPSTFLARYIDAVLQVNSGR
jgi:hypothetical protein